jgi:hypothetical protein
MVQKKVPIIILEIIIGILFIKKPYVPIKTADKTPNIIEIVEIESAFFILYI